MLDPGHRKRLAHPFVTQRRSRSLRAEAEEVCLTAVLGDPDWRNHLYAATGSIQIPELTDLQTTSSLFDAAVVRLSGRRVGRRQPLPWHDEVGNMRGANDDGHVCGRGQRVDKGSRRRHRAGRCACLSVILHHPCKKMRPPGAGGNPMAFPKPQACHINIS